MSASHDLSNFIWNFNRHFYRYNSPRPLGACRTLESSAANRPQRPLFHRLLAPWNNHAAANPAKNGLAGADFRYRRPKSDRLLAEIDADLMRAEEETVRLLREVTAEMRA